MIFFVLIGVMREDESDCIVCSVILGLLFFLVFDKKWKENNLSGAVIFRFFIG